MLFGTVEYYEKEIVNQLFGQKIRRLNKEDAALGIISVLKNEILYAFFFDEKKRAQSLQNLLIAFGNLSVKQHGTPNGTIGSFNSKVTYASEVSDSTLVANIGGR